MLIKLLKATQLESDSHGLPPWKPRLRKAELEASSHLTVNQKSREALHLSRQLKAKPGMKRGWNLRSLKAPPCGLATALYPQVSRMQRWPACQLLRLWAPLVTPPTNY